MAFGSDTRALLRLGRRNARRNRRRTLLVVAVIALPIALAVAAASAQRSLLTTAEQQRSWALGSADGVVMPAATDDGGAPVVVDPQRARLVPRTTYWLLVGRFEVQVQAVDLADPVLAPTIADFDGRAPTDEGEVAVSAALAEELDLQIGSLWQVPGAALERTVVATYVDAENRRGFRATLAPDASLSDAPPTGTGGDGFRDYLVVGDLDAVEAAGPVIPRHDWFTSTRDAVLELDRPSVFSSFVSVVLLIEAGLVAAAAFATGVRRRITEFGLLSSVGATPRQLRRAVVSEAAAAAVVAVPAGLALGVATSVATRPLVQRLADHVVDGVGVRPQDLIGPAIVGFVATLVAAWVPARLAARVPATVALAGRVPSTPLTARAVPGGLVALGAGAFVVFAAAEVARNAGETPGVVYLMLGAGVLLALAGAATLGAWAMARIGGWADWLPGVARLVARDARRQSTRSVVAVGALVVVAAFPLAVAVLAESIERDVQASHLPAAAPDEVVLSSYGFVPGEDVAPVAEADIDRVAGAVGVTSTTEFATLGRTVTETGFDHGDEVHEYVAEFYLAGFGTRGSVALATDELVAGLRLGDAEAPVRAALEAGVAVNLHPQETDGDMAVLWGGPESVELPVRAVAARDAFHATPALLVPVELAQRHGFEVVARHTLLQTAQPLTDADRDGLRDAFASDCCEPIAQGVDAPSRAWPQFDDPPSRIAARVQWIAVAVAAALALLIGGCTTALAATESDRSIATMVAVGAEPRMRRRFLGAQSAYHAGVGSLLALPVVMMLLWAVYRGDNEGIDLVVPVLPVVVLVLGVPLVLGGATALLVRSAPLSATRRSD